MMAKALAQNGAAKVYIAGRRPDVLEKASLELGPDTVTPLVCDVTSEASLRAAAGVVEAGAGRLNLLVCNSGIGGPQAREPAADDGGTTAAEWAAVNLAHGFGEYVRTFEVNTAAVWYTTMAFLALLDKGNDQKGGGLVGVSSQVVVTSSIGGFNKKAPGGWAYGQSKAATNLLVKQLAVLLPRWNIRYVSAVPVTPGSCLCVWELDDLMLAFTGQTPYAPAVSDVPE
jgi:NAD(P)-dependent dehydrogenase (short-subunit alcohol dehydrogenase family)